MADSHEVTTQSITLVNNEASTTILKGYAVTWAGTLATSPVDFAGVNRFDAEPGEPMTVVQGRVWVKFNGTPGANVELSVHTDGTFDAAVATDIVVGTQKEAAIVSYPTLGMAAIVGPSYVKPAP
jgi:hypothetical protein